MNDIIKKKLIVESIHGWYVLDQILFYGSPDIYLKEHGDALTRYNMLKKKYLKTVFEFYNIIGYKSSFNQLPKKCGEIEHKALIVFENLKRELKDTFNSNKKGYCKIITEGVDTNNDALLEKRTHFLGRSLMIENHFINKPLRLKSGNIDSERLTIYKNCLNEISQQLLNLSYKYYKNF